MTSLTSFVAARLRQFSFLGLLLGGVFFALSLTPSLIPRSYLFQGVLGGVCIAAGYGIGVFSGWLWRWLELPQPRAGFLTLVQSLSTALAAIIAVCFLWRSAAWQNSIRDLMGMELLDTANPFRVMAIAFVVGLVLIYLGRAVGVLMRLVSRGLLTVMPQRLAGLLGAVIVGLVLINLANGVLAKSALRVMDSSYQALDRFIDPEIAAPSFGFQPGSTESLIGWDELGSKGREFVTSGPTAQDIAAFSGAPAKHPLRIFVGLNSADTMDQRAELALEELKRVDAFARKLLVIVTPTGTGWIDPMAADTLEYLHNGDTAMVAMQYSYLSSYISLLAEPERAQQAAAALFDVVYGYWRSLPETQRPQLYLYGLSLGSLGSEASADLITILGDPIDGALWAGPPFTNPIWRSVTNDRVKGSPAWLPRFRDGSLIRFANQETGPRLPGSQWGPLRIVYLQYASDPVVFFDPGAAFSRPEWMIAPRGPDVSPDFTWYPVVTFVQLLLDMAAALSPPIGHGHTYAANDYIDAWIEVTAVDNWGNDKIHRLKQLFAD